MMQRGQWKVWIQQLAGKVGYRIMRLDPTVSLDDAYQEQVRLLNRRISTIFEVGAADGRDSIAYAGLFPNADVYAFEPIPESFAKVADLAAAQPRLKPVECAMSDAPGTATFHICAFEDASSLLKPRATGASFDAYQEEMRTISVAVNTLDIFCRDHKIDHIDLLKMDAQGAENRILRGASDLLARGAIDVIYTEIQFIESYEGAGLFGEMFDLLRKNDFYLHNLYDLHHNHRGEICWGDAIFVHNRLRRRD